MGHDWILDVLADLKAYAEQNDLLALKRQLDETTRVATAEIGSARDGAPIVAVWDDADTLGLISSAAGGGRRA